MAAASFAIIGCRQDMHDQPKYIPLRESSFFGDLRSERPLPHGVVARGHLNEDVYLYTGKLNGAEGAVFPFAITADDLRRGEDRYNIYCMPCHSPIGDGRGMIVRRGFKQPPTYHDDTLRQKPVGHFFDVISNGYGAMPDYSSQIPDARDRWRIAAYIRVLQLSQHATLAEVPEQERPNLGTPRAMNQAIGGDVVTPPTKVTNPNSRGERP